MIVLLWHYLKRSLHHTVSDGSSTAIFKAESECRHQIFFILLKAAQMFIMIEMQVL